MYSFKNINHVESNSFFYEYKIYLFNLITIIIHRILLKLRKSQNPLITFLKKIRKRFFLQMKDYPSEYIGLKNICDVHFSQFGQDVLVGDILSQKKKDFLLCRS